MKFKLSKKWILQDLKCYNFYSIYQNYNFWIKIQLNFIHTTIQDKKDCDGTSRTKPVLIFQANTIRTPELLTLLPN
jgi:hypothetical protein